MVREIISIGVGQCGVNMMEAHWESMLKEHQIGLDGMVTSSPEKNLNVAHSVYFDESIDGGYVPRGILACLDDNPINRFRSLDMANNFRQDCFISSGQSTGNNWAVGHYTRGAEKINEIMDQVRTQAENSDCLHSFHFAHSLSGGTGSGLGTLCISNVRENYPDRCLYTFAEISPTESDVVTGVYNTVLAIHQLVENTDFGGLMNSKAIEDILFRDSPGKKVTLKDINNHYQKTISGLSAGMRFPGLLNIDWRKLIVGLVPFPRLHFFSLVHSQEPIANAADSGMALATKRLVHRIFDSNYNMAGWKLLNGRNLTMATLFRGPVSTYDIENTVMSKINRNSSYFVEWIPDNLKGSFCSREESPNTVSCTGVHNSTSQQIQYKQISEQFTAMFRRKAFLHWYTGEGMDEMEFTEAESNLNDLVSEFWNGSCCEADDEEDFEGLEEEME